MKSSEDVIRVHSDPTSLDTMAWNGLLARQTRPTPFMRLEYLAALPNPQSKLVYVQELVAKPQRDIRVIVAEAAARLPGGRERLGRQVGRRGLSDAAAEPAVDRHRMPLVQLAECARVGTRRAHQCDVGSPLHQG